jgi:energy-coupling factor transporter ATP-binding protein EcfA2
MVVIIKNNISFGLDPWYKANLDILLQKAIPNKWDALIIVFGREGAGKSTLASQTALYLHEQYDIKYTVFSPEQFIEVCDNCEEEAAINWDEAITGANAQMYAEQISRIIISKLTQIRKKRLKIILCFPYLWMLNKYYVSRSIFSVYTYATAFDNRGHAKFYDSRKTELIYGLMKDRFKYDWMKAISCVKPNFYFRFSSKFILDEEKYDIKKTESIKQAALNPNAQNIWKERTQKLLMYIRDKTDGTINKAARHLDLKPHVLHSAINKDRLVQTN